ncbi:YadA-like family protein [Uruburuella testudinis]|uniref:YadA-like family protein n=1 Tax=Uruburuella testudinis TaxID=1282863 RepID=A0ABY4DQY0_9NEIS|nr:ESPR-type extended signal peptide-containing protein [Uruburuella testudinis]UOO81454.1 YadA-like family protein [Uruburuella testudinis]
MNKIYKIIWNKITNTWVVTSELSNAHGKSTAGNVVTSQPVETAALSLMFSLKASAVAIIMALFSTNAAAYESWGTGRTGATDIIMGGGSGTRASAAGDNSTIIGANAKGIASNDNRAEGATAVGSGAQATGGATALGWNAKVAGTTGGVALGADTSVTGSNAMAMGWAASASGNRGIAIGTSSGATNATASQANSADSIAIGTGAVAEAAISNTTNQGANISIGKDAYSSNYGAAAQIIANRNGSGGDMVFRGPDGVGTTTRIQPSSVSIGEYSEAYSGSTAVGYNNIAGTNGATGMSAFAFGNSNEATSPFSMAMGLGNKSTGGSSVALGTVNTASGDTSIAIGRQVTASGNYSTALGNVASATGNNAFAVGHSSEASGLRSIAIGSTLSPNNSYSTGTEAKGTDAIALGTQAVAVQKESIAIGKDVRADGQQSIAIGSTKSDGGGQNTQAYTSNAIAIGVGAIAGINGASASSNSQNTAVGYNAKATGHQSTAIGSDTLSSGNFATALGIGSEATAMGASAVGGGQASAQDAVAIGGYSQATVNDSIALGSSSVANRAAGQAGFNTVTNASSTNTNSTWKATTAALSIGSNTITRQITGVAAGSADTDAVNVAQLKNAQTHYYSVNSAIATAGSNYNNDGATGVNALAAGVSASATQKDAVAVGANAKGTGESSVAIGAAQANSAHAIAIGNAATTSNNADSAIAMGHLAKAENNYSVAIGSGAKAGVANDTRVTGAVAIGSSTQALANQATAIGTYSNVSGQNSVAVGVQNTVAQANTVAVGSNITTSQANSVVLGNASTDRAATAETSATVGGVTYNGFAGQGKAANGVVSVGTAGKERQIINVAAGQISASSTDAINGSQLYAVASKPITFAGDSGTNINRKLGEILNIKGGNTSTLTDNNIGVVSDGSGTLNVKLAQNLTNLSSIAITGGSTINSDGINMNGNKITNVGTGSAPNDAVNYSQLQTMETKATAAQNTADTANITANNALSNAATAQTAANNAQTTANSKLGSFTVGADSAATAAGITVDNNNTRFDVVGKDGIATSVNGNQINVALDETTKANMDKIPAIESMANQNATDIATNKGDIAKNTVAINDNTSKIADNTTALAKNTGDIATNTTAISDNTTDIQKLTSVVDAGTFTVSANGNAAKDRIAKDENIDFVNGTNTTASYDAATNTVKYSVVDAPTFTGTVTSNTGFTTGGVRITPNGIDAGSKKITNVANGAEPNDAVNFSQLSAVETKADNAQTAANNAQTKAEQADAAAAQAQGAADAANTSATTALANAAAAQTAADSKLTSFKVGADTNGTSTETVEIKNGNERFDIVGVNGGKVETKVDGNKITVDLTEATKTKIDNAASTEQLNAISTKYSDGKATTDLEIGKDETLTLKGGDSNINTTINATDKAIEFALNKTLTGLTEVQADKFTAGNVVVSSDGINAGSKKITNVADGTEANDAVNFSQLETVKTAADAADANATKANEAAAEAKTAADAKLENFTVGADQAGAATGIAISNDSTRFDIVGADDGKVETKVDGNKITVDLTADTKAKIDNAASNADLTTLEGKQLTFSGDVGNGVARKLGETLKLNGGVTDPTNVTTGNISVSTNDAGDGLDIELAKNIELTEDGSINFGDNGLMISDDGVGFNDGKDGFDATAPQISRSGIDAGNKVISNVAAGVADTDAVNKKQLDDVSTAMGNLTTKYSDGKATTDLEIGKDDKLTLKGGDSNITTTINATDKAIEFALNKTLTGLTEVQADKFTAGDVVISKDNGINAGSKKITNVADGAENTDAVNFGQLDTVKTAADAAQTAADAKLANVLVGVDTAGADTTNMVTLDKDGNRLDIVGQNGVETKVDGKKITVGLDQATQDQLKNVESAVGAVATKYQGDKGEEITIANGKALKIQGAADDAATKGNIITNAAGDTLSIEMSKTLNGLTSVAADTFTAGDVVISKDNGINAGNKKITNVANGTEANDAVNFSQLETVKTDVTAAAAAADAKAEKADEAAKEAKTTADAKLESFTVGADQAGTATGIAISKDSTRFDIVGADDGKVETKVDGNKITVDLTAETKEKIDNAASNADLTTLEGKQLTFSGDVGNGVARKLGETLKLNGGVTDPANVTTGNIAVSTNAAGDGLDIELAKNIELTEDGSINFGSDGLMISDDGVGFAAGDTFSNAAPLISKDGISAGNTKITNVAAGVADTDAVNKKQLDDVSTAMGNLTTVYSDGKADTDLEIGKGEKLTLKGGEDNNIVATIDSANKAINFTLAKELKGLTSVEAGTFTAGGVSMSSDGINAGSKKITNVADGTEANDAVNFGQLETVKTAADAADANATKANEAAAEAKTAADEKLANVLVGVDTNSADTTNMVTLNKDGNRLDIVGQNGVETKVDGKKITVGLDQATQDQLKNVESAVGAVATKYQGDKGEEITIANGKALKIQGAADDAATKGNIITNAAGDTLSIEMSKTLNGLTSVAADTFTAGDVVISKDNGINAGNKKITNVANGTEANDAVNFSQLETVKTDVTAAAAAADAKAEKADEAAKEAKTTADAKLANFTVGADKAGAAAGIAISKDSTRFDIVGADDGKVETKVDGNKITVDLTADTKAKIDNAASTADLTTLEGKQLTFSGDVGDGVARKLGETLKLNGGVTDPTNVTTGNISVSTNAAGDGLDIELAKNIELTEDGSINFGDNGVMITDDGVGFNDGKDGFDATAPQISRSGIDAGNTKISNVAAGVADTDAVNKKQLDEVSTAMGNLTTKYSDGQATTDLEIGSGDKLTLKGGDSNIVAAIDSANKAINFTLAKDLKGLTSVAADTFTAGDVSISKDKGINAGDKQIANVASGLNGTDLAAAAGDMLKNAANIGDLQAVNSSVIKAQESATEAKTAADAKLASFTVGTTGVDGAKVTVDKDNSHFDIKGENGIATAVDAEGKSITVKLDEATKAKIDNAATADSLNGLSVAFEDENGNKVSNKLSDNKAIQLKGDDNISVTADADSGALQFGFNKDLTIGKAAENGQAGEDGKLAVNGKDGSAVVINGADGSIGLTGPKGDNGEAAPTTNIAVKNGAKGLDGKDGETATRITYTNGKDAEGNDIVEEVATLNDGLKFKGDKGDDIAKKLNETLTIKGGAAEGAEMSSNNIRVDSEDGNLVVKLAKELTDLNKATFGTNGNTTTISDNGITIAKQGENGEDGKTVSLTDKGLDNGGNVLSNVGNGVKDTDAANIANVKELVSKATADGFSLADDNGETIKQSLGSTIAVKGDGKNISTQVVKDADGKAEALQIAFNNDLTIGEKAENGEAGEDGKLAVNGKDGSAVTLNGKDGTIGLNGKDGQGTTIGVNTAGAKGLNGKDGETATRITYTNGKDADGNDIVEQVATLNDGLKFAGNSGEAAKKLNETVSIKGADANTDSSKFDAGKNLMTSVEDGTMRIALAKDLSGLNSATFTTDGATTVINGKGITIGEGDKVVSLTDKGLDNGGNVLSNVGKGEKDTDAANIANVKEAVDSAVGSITDKGFGVKTQDGTQTAKLGETVEIVGADSNISTKVADGKVQIQLAKDIDLGNDGSLSVGGVNVKDGKISGVKDGDISATSSDVVTGKQLYAVNNATITNPDGTTTEVNIKDQVINNNVDNSNSKSQFLTYNTSGQQTTDHQTIAQTVQSMNTGGVKYFHTNNTGAEKGDIGATNDSSAGGANSTAVGVNAIVADTGTSAVAVGHNTKASGESAVAIGHGSIAAGKQSLSIGTGNNVTGNHSGAIGDPNTVSGNASYALGNNNTVSTANTFVVGNDVTETLENSVVLGNKSSAKQINRADHNNGSSYTYLGVNDEQVAGVADVGGVVSVGSEGNTRQIQNVAAGVVSATSTDAINGSQLYDTHRAIDNVAVGVNQLSNRVEKLSRDIDGVGATAAAMASLPQAIQAGESMVAIAGGAHRAQRAIALGISSVSDNGKMVFKLNASHNSRGTVSSGVGFGYRW